MSKRWYWTNLLDARLAVKSGQRALAAGHITGREARELSLLALLKYRAQVRR